MDMYHRTLGQQHHSAQGQIPPAAAVVIQKNRNSGAHPHREPTPTAGPAPTPHNNNTNTGLQVREMVQCVLSPQD